MCLRELEMVVANAGWARDRLETYPWSRLGAEVLSPNFSASSRSRELASRSRAFRSRVQDRFLLKFPCDGLILSGPYKLNR